MYKFFVLSSSEYFHQLLALFMRSCTLEPSHIFVHQQSPGAELGQVSTPASALRETMALSLSCKGILLDMVLNFLWDTHTPHCVSFSLTYVIYRTPRAEFNSRLQHLNSDICINVFTGTVNVYPVGHLRAWYNCLHMSVKCYLGSTSIAHLVCSS